MNQLNGNGSREAWASRFGVILAVTGSAVGLGNFLRFPGLAAQYGGAFMIPYVIAFLLLGLPIAWVEWSMGRYGGRHGFNSLPGIYRTIWSNRMAPFFGALGIVIPVMIYMYYVYIEGWCLAYSFRYLLGLWDANASPEDFNNFFETFVGVRENGSALDTSSGSFFGSAVFFLTVCFVVNFVLIYRGLTKGIEWFCKWAMPALVLCALVILVRVLTLGTPIADKPDQNVLNGLGYMWNPSRPDATLLESLSHSEIWLAAAGQIFFSLSVGFGIIITYASYLREDDDVALSSLTAASGNGFCEVALGGLITIPAAFVFLGYEFVKKPPGTFGMGFVALPNVFNQMFAGRLFGFLFFFLLFLAAVTSSLSMLQPAIALLEEGLGLGRKASVAMLGFITAVGAAFVVFFSKNLMALDTIDFWVATFCIYVLATFQVVLFAWVLGVEEGFRELSRGAEIRIPGFVRYVIKYVSPVYLLTIFGFWFYQEFLKTPEEGKITRLGQIAQEPVAQASVGLVVIVGVLFLLLIAQSVKRWRRLEQQEEVWP